MTSEDQDLEGIGVGNIIDLNGGSLTYTFEGEVKNADLEFSSANSSSILVDTPIIGPAVTDFIESFNGTYSENGVLIFQVNFEEEVIVTNTPRLVLNIGGTTRYASYASGNGTTSLEFRYTVQASDQDDDGIGISSNIDLNNGSIIAVSDSDPVNQDFSYHLDSLTNVLIDNASGIVAPDQVASLLDEFSSTSTAKVFSINSLNPIAWLSATNIANDGDKIASWSDISGNASPTTESDPNNQPLYEANVQNGLPAVGFNGFTRSLEGTFTRVNNSGLTVFLVGKMDQNNTRKCFFEFYSTTITRRGFFFNHGFNEATTNYNLDDTGFNVWTAYDDGSNIDL